MYCLFLLSALVLLYVQFITTSSDPFHYTPPLYLCVVANSFSSFIVPHIRTPTYPTSFSFLPSFGLSRLLYLSVFILVLLFTLSLVPFPSFCISLFFYIFVISTATSSSSFHLYIFFLLILGLLAVIYIHSCFLSLLSWSHFSLWYLMLGETGNS